MIYGHVSRYVTERARQIRGKNVVFQQLTDHTRVKNVVEKNVNERDDGDCYARLTIAELSCTAKDE